MPNVIPVDFQIPGDPPSPKTIICHLLNSLKRLILNPLSLKQKIRMLDIYVSIHLLSHHRVFFALLLSMARAFVLWFSEITIAVANWCGNLFAILGAIAGLRFLLSALISVSTFSVCRPYLSASPVVVFQGRCIIRLFLSLSFHSSPSWLPSSLSDTYDHYYKKYNIGALGFFYNIFLAGMVMVVSANRALFFLVVWEDHVPCLLFPGYSLSIRKEKM